MTLYDDMQQIASDLFTEFDQPTIKLIQMTPGSGSAFDPGAATPTPQTLKGATARGVSSKYVRNGLAVATDLQVSFAGDNPAPKMTDFVDVNGDRLKIVNIVRKPASGVVIAWTVIARKGN